VDSNSYSDSLSLAFNLPESLMKFMDEFREEITREVPKIVEAVTDMLEAEWKREAANTFKSVEKYNNSFVREEVSPIHTILKNVHPAALYLEYGTAPFDLKRMLDTSSHVKISKDGKRYLRIPFEGKVKDYIAGGVDKDEIRSMAGSRFVTIKSGERERNVIVKYGDRLTDIGNTGRKRKYFTVLNAPRERFPNKTNSPNMGKPFTEYRAATTVDYAWKSSPYEGAVKIVGTHGTEGMKTFRTISDNSDPNSWIHPGIHASHIAEKSIATTLPQLDAQISSLLEPLFARLSNVGFS
jgi:hypothetical protein